MLARIPLISGLMASLTFVGGQQVYAADSRDVAAGVAVGAIIGGVLATQRPVAVYQPAPPVYYAPPPPVAYYPPQPVYVQQPVYYTPGPVYYVPGPRYYRSHWKQHPGRKYHRNYRW